jgi:hypothetical protein
MNKKKMKNKYLHGKIDILQKNQITESRLFKFPEHWKNNLTADLIKELLDFLPTESQITLSFTKLSQKEYNEENKKYNPTL